MNSCSLAIDKHVSIGFSLCAQNLNEIVVFHIKMHSKQYFTTMQLRFNQTLFAAKLNFFDPISAWFKAWKFQFGHEINPYSDKHGKISLPTWLPRLNICRIIRDCGIENCRKENWPLRVWQMHRIFSMLLNLMALVTDGNCGRFIAFVDAQDYKKASALLRASLHWTVNSEQDVKMTKHPKSSKKSQFNSTPSWLAFKAPNWIERNELREEMI